MKVRSENRKSGRNVGLAAGLLALLAFAIACELEEADDGGSDDDVWVASSIDGGGTWTAPRALNAGARSDQGHDGGPQVAADGLGRWLAVWDSNGFKKPFRKDWDILVARSSDGGASWSGQDEVAANANRDSGDDYWPDLMTDGRGVWLAVWFSKDSLGGTIGKDWDILFARSTDDGATWVGPTVLNANASSDVGEDYRPQLATDREGTWIVTWHSNDPLGTAIGSDYDILFARSTDDGASWSAPAALNANAASDEGGDYWPHVETDGLGAWVAVWHSVDSLGGSIWSDLDVLVARSNDDGATWSAPQALNSTAASCCANDSFPRVATDRSGTWIASWVSPDPLTDSFGTSVVDLGDLDGDGVGDLAVGAYGDGDGGSPGGAVWILFMDATGTIGSYRKIGDAEGGFTGSLGYDDRFGTQLAALGDQDGDGVVDLAVGARGDDDGGTDRGAVWILFLNTDGTVKAHQKISDTQGGFTGDLDDRDWFGFGVASLGDHDGDGYADLAVCAPYDDDGGNGRGAVWILFLNADGTVRSHQKISDTAGGFTGYLDDDDAFGRWITSLSDLDRNGVNDLVVSALGDDDGGRNRGAVWILLLNPNGTVKSQQKISDTEGGFEGLLDDDDSFGNVLVDLGDLDGNGAADLAIGDYPSGGGIRVVWIVFLDTDGTVMAHRGFGGFKWPSSIGDFDGDGVGDVVTVDTETNDLWIIGLHADGTMKFQQEINDAEGEFEQAPGRHPSHGWDEDIFVSRSYDDGASWTVQTPLNTNSLSDAGNDAHVRLTTDELGTWVAVWESTDTLSGSIGGDRDILVASSTDDGATWTPPIPLNTTAASDSTDDRRPDVATDRQGTWVAVWEHDDLH